MCDFHIFTEYQHTVLVSDVNNITLIPFQNKLSWAEFSFKLIFAEINGHSYYPVVRSLLCRSV